MGGDWAMDVSRQGPKSIIQEQFPNLWNELSLVEKLGRPRKK